MRCILQALLYGTWHTLACMHWQISQSAAAMYIAACCCYGTLIKAKLPYGIRFPAGTVWMKLLARMVPPRLAWPFRTTGPMCWGRQAVNRPGCLLRAALHIIHRCAKVAWSAPLADTIAHLPR